MSLALEIDGLTKTFHLGFLGALRPFRKVADALQMKGIAYRVDAVRGISLNVEQGEIFGFLGPNGAGKTTTIKMLMGPFSVVRAIDFELCANSHTSCTESVVIVVGCFLSLLLSLAGGIWMVGMVGVVWGLCCFFLCVLGGTILSAQE